MLTLDSNAEANFVQSTRTQRFWKSSKPCRVGMHLIALAQYCQMSTHMPGIQSIFSFFASFCIAKISHQHNG